MDSTTTLPSATRQHDGAHGAQEPRRARVDQDHHLRALAHDMSANFMLLEDSFGRLRRALGKAPADQLEQMAEHVEACLEQSRGLLDDLVRLGRTGSVEMEPQRVELAGVVEEVLFELHQELDRRGVIASVQQPLPAVWCNRQRVKQILANLLGNAVRYGCDQILPRVSIRASAELAGDGSGGPSGIVLRVHDNGPGIAAADAEEVFLPGRRLASARLGGSGMGLAIVRRIAEHYGGRAWVDLDDLPGATICVRLPAAPAAPWCPNTDRDGDSRGNAPRPYRPHTRRRGPRRRLAWP